MVHSFPLFARVKAAHSILSRAREFATRLTTVQKFKSERGDLGFERGALLVLGKKDSTSRQGKTGGGWRKR